MSLRVFAKFLTSKMPGLSAEDRNHDDAFLCLSIFFSHPLSLSSFLFVSFNSIFFQFEFLETGGEGVGVVEGCRECY